MTLPLGNPVWEGGRGAGYHPGVAEVVDAAAADVVHPEERQGVGSQEPRDPGAKEGREGRKGSGIRGTSHRGRNKYRNGCFLQKHLPMAFLYEPPPHTLNGPWGPLRVKKKAAVRAFLAIHTPGGEGVQLPPAKRLLAEERLLAAPQPLISDPGVEKRAVGSHPSPL